MEFRDIESAVSNPNGNGFVCYFCDRETEKPFHSAGDTKKHYKICKFGPTAIVQNFKSGYIYKNPMSCMCALWRKETIDKCHKISHWNASSRAPSKEFEECCRYCVFILLAEFIQVVAVFFNKSE